MTELQPNSQSSEVATTGSDVARPSPALNYRPRIPRTKETDLTKRERLIVRYMVHGPHHHTLAERIIRNGEPVKVGEPLTPEEAASLCLIRRSHVRWLLTQPAFQRYLAKETAAFRIGAQARAWRKMDELAHTPGDGSAAWAKVNQQAASAIIGEGEGQRGPSVQVNINNQHITPGYVIDLSPQAPTIEAQANEESPDVER